MIGSMISSRTTGTLSKDDSKNHSKSPSFLAGLWLLLLLTGPSTSGASDVLYRCEIEGVTVFSDQPCSRDAQRYTSGGSISVVPPAADLDQIAEANQALLDQRRQAQADRAVARRQSESPAIQAARPAAAEVQSLPWTRHGWPAYGYDFYRPYQHRHGSTPEQVPAPPRRYSALSGPFPGSRRRDQDEPR